MDPSRSELPLDGPASSLVTGGSKGIGRAVALDLAAPGRTLVLNYAEDQAAAEATRSEAEDRGARVVLARGDVSDAAFRSRLADIVTAETDGLGQFVHCAVRSSNAAFADLDPRELERAVAVNGTSLPLLAHALRHSLRDGTSIVFLTSIGAQRAIPGYMALGAPKAMAESFVRYLAVELAHRGVRTNTVSCSSLPTEAFRRAIKDADAWYSKMADRNPSGRNITFDEVTHAVRFLCSPYARMVNGKELTVDGGLYSRL
ncbi:MAG: enoyl-[acyl-carrier-protein] reductase FabL [Marmoricola sp.]|nr:enoyl-[acyl-carrier-protein] reductase FabL [Marmoricola sp.]